MRNFTLLMVIFSMFFAVPTLQANESGREGTYYQLHEKLISISVDQVLIKEALYELQKVSGISFIYDSKELPNDAKVSIKVNNVTVKSALDELLIDTNLTYKVIDNGVSIFRSPDAVSAQPQDNRVSISGTILDEDSKPIAGATVLVTGTSEGAITDESGRFILDNITVGAAIEVSITGYLSQTFTVKADTKEYSIKLKLDELAVDDVVVTGIFEKPRESYTGAVTTINKKELAMFKGQNMLQTLANIDPAFNIAQDNFSGSDPNRKLQITIRGNSSLPKSLDELESTEGQALNTPLVIMDGFEITMDQLQDFNDDMIESITILKDASSTAIYGSRGANGVVVIKTKEPVAGKLRVFVSGGITMEVPDLSSYNLMGAIDKLALERMVGLYSDLDPEIQMELNNAYNARVSDALRGETEWIREPVRVGVGRTVNLRLEGGSNEFRWSVSANNKVTTGAMKGSDRESSGANITLNYNYKNLMFRNSATLSLVNSDNGTYGSFSEYAAINTYNRPYDEEGNLIKIFSGGTSLGGQYNPLYNAQLSGKDVSSSTVLTNVFSVDWQPLAGLAVRGKLGLSKSFNDADVFIPADHTSFNDQDDLFKKGSYNYSVGNAFNLESSLTANYSKIFNEKHLMSVGVDASILSDNSRTTSLSAVGFLSPEFTDLANALGYTEGSRPSNIYDESASVGFTGTFNYTFDERLFVDGSLRVDGSSKFGANNRFAPFWSLGAGWNIHRENFMKNQEVFNNLRLRMSTGVSGSQQFSSFDALSMYGMTSSSLYYYWNTSYLLGLGNENLTWQTTAQHNLGVDLGMFGGRLTGQLDVYYKRTDDLLSTISLSPSHGFASYAENVGVTSNRGFEATLGGYIIRDLERDLNWSVTGRIAYAVSEIVELSDEIKEQTIAAHQYDEDAALLYEGVSQDALYAVRSVGIDPISGKELFLDANGDVTYNWTPDARVYCGNAQPLYQGSISSMLQYKKFTFNVSFGYHWGGVQYNETLIDRVELPIYEMSSNVDQRVYDDRWQKPGDVTFFKGYSNDVTEKSTRFVMDDKAFDLQSMSLQYRWDTNFVTNKLKAQSITLGVNASNLFYFSTIARERGTDYPFANNIQFNVSINF